MIQIADKFIVAFLAYLEFSATPASGNIACEWVERFGGWCHSYERLKYNGSLLTCSYMCALQKSTSCYNYEEKESSCLVFGLHARNGACYNGDCIPIPRAKALFKMITPKRTLDCVPGHDYLYNDHGPFGCKYYCNDASGHANRPDGIVCQMLNTAKIGKCDETGNCVL
ncbi:uncharacterized protein LOC135397077 [Ornithodoros turicata]|uniref:uncharacterized protein LOC135397077 n=1 Tax=Ornithodoros turicata TaxID=34597 RepID=UPI0031397691